MQGFPLPGSGVSPFPERFRFTGLGASWPSLLLLPFFFPKKGGVTLGGLPPSSGGFSPRSCGLSAIAPPFAGSSFVYARAVVRWWAGRFFGLLP